MNKIFYREISNEIHWMDATGTYVAKQWSNGKYDHSTISCVDWMELYKAKNLKWWENPFAEINEEIAIEIIKNFQS